MDLFFLKLTPLMYESHQDILKLSKRTPAAHQISRFSEGMRHPAALLGAV